jgi:hypothetical protein
MDVIKATVKSGRLELESPLHWPDGTEVRIEATMVPLDKIGIDESAWSDDAASLADWEAWIKTIEPLEFTPEESASMTEFDQRMRAYNLEAVRHQMQQGAGA